VTGGRILAVASWTNKRGKRTVRRIHVQCRFYAHVACRASGVGAPLATDEALLVTFLLGLLPATLPAITPAFARR
jgi:hypothetical protein